MFSIKHYQMVDIVGTDLLPLDTSKLQYFTFLTLEQPLFPSDQIHSGLVFCGFFSTKLS